MSALTSPPPLAPAALRVQLVQLNYTLNDFSGNAAKICTAIAAAADTDLIVFSELCLSGYYPQDLVEEPDFLPRQQQALEQVLAASRNTAAAIVIGAVTRNTGVGKPLHNSLLVLQGGEVVLRYAKQLLPTYNIFDEHRHFEPGEPRAALFRVKGVQVGFLICEDGWNDAGLDYAANPWDTLQQAGAELVVSINASPSHLGKVVLRQSLFCAVAERRQMPVVYVNQVGAHDQIVFDGASFVAEPQRGVVFALPAFEEAQAPVEFCRTAEGLQVNTPTLVLPVPLDDSAFHYRQILQGLRDYVRKVGFEAVVVGSSGGIDSALTLALAVDALGPERVRAITMPSAFSSAGSVNDSVALCRNLGVRLDEYPIATLFDQYNAGFAQAFGQDSTRLTRENLQARIRGTVLMAFSNEFGHLLLTTGNKSEISVGYFTLYGDSNGGLNLIGDLYKTEVFALARYYNQLHGREIIPQSVIDKPPSAELSPGQQDTDSLPPYEVLDEILKLHIEGQRLRPEEFARAQAFCKAIIQRGEGDMIQRVLGLIQRSEFKRRQAPPIIRLRNRAFGNGRQMPLAVRHATGLQQAHAGT